MDVQLWEGGQAFLPDCGECKVSVCPAPHRMAAHRRRAPYNMGGAFDYECDVVNRVCYDLLTEGDTLWMVLVPEDSYTTLIRVKVTAADPVNVITFNTVAEVINGETCEVISTPVVPVAVQGLSTAAVDAALGVLDPAIYTDPYASAGTVREVLRVGLQLATFPANGLAAFLGRIELTVVAQDFETVQIADCRANGPCIIDNP